MVKAVTVECLVDLRMSVAQYCVRTASNCQFGETNKRVDSTLFFVLEPIRMNTHKCFPLSTQCLFVCYVELYFFKHHRLCVAEDEISSG